MVNPQAYTLLYKIHSWGGLFLSSIVLIMCISGMINLFFDELELWEQPAYRDIDIQDSLPLHATIQKILRRYNLNPHRSIRIKLPDNIHRALRLEIPIINQDEKIIVDINPVTREILVINKFRLVDFFQRLHARLLLPSPFGNYIVGVFGYILMLIITIGILLHKNFFKAFFTFRYQKSLRLLILDSHRLFGLWALLFHIMIVFTGASIGLSHAIVGLTEKAVDLAAPIQEIATKSSDEIEPSFQSAEMADLDNIIHIAEKTLPDSKPYYLTLLNWNGSNGQVLVKSALPYHLSRYAELNFNAVTGKLNSRFIHSEDAGIFSRAFETIITLHFADYLNIWVKLSYFIFAAMSAFLAVSGLLLWIESNKRRYGTTTISKIYQLVMGVQLGFIFSIAALMLGHRLAGFYFQINNFFRFDLLLFFICWFICILTSLYIQNTRTLLSAWLLLISVLLLLTSLTNVLLNPTGFYQLVQYDNWPIFIPDLFLISFSILFFSIWLLVKRQ